MLMGYITDILHCDIFYGLNDKMLIQNTWMQDDDNLMLFSVSG